MSSQISHRLRKFISTLCSYTAAFMPGYQGWRNVIKHCHTGQQSIILLNLQGRKVD